MNELANINGWSKHVPLSAKNLFDGVQYVFRFENGYGASLINHSNSYGNELGVIRWEGEGWHLTYKTPITDDVLGRLTVGEIEGYLDAIKALPNPDEITSEED